MADHPFGVSSAFFAERRSSLAQLVLRASRLKACGLCRSSGARPREHVTVGTTVICLV
jgi:hypothetical protein